MTGLEMTIPHLFQEDHGKAVDLDAEHDDEEGERDVGDDGDEGVVADGDEHRQHEAEGAGAAHRVLPVHQVLHDGLGGGKVDHGGGEEEVAGGCCRTSWCAAAAQRLPRLRWQAGRAVAGLDLQAVQASDHASAAGDGQLGGGVQLLRILRTRTGHGRGIVSTGGEPGASLPPFPPPATSSLSTTTTFTSCIL